MNVVLEKLKKIDMVDTINLKLDYIDKEIKAMAANVAAREATVSQLLLEQNSIKTGYKILGGLVILLFPCIIAWNVYLQQDLKRVQEKVIMLESRRP